MFNTLTPSDNLKQSKSTLISYYSTLHKKTNTPITIEKLLQFIKTGEGFKPTILSIRKQSDKAKQNEFKKKLPAVTISGLFGESRKGDNLIEHSGFIQIDFDNVPDIQQSLKALQSDPYSFAIFISPTNTGIKLIVKISPDKATHLNCYLQLEKYYKENFNLVADIQCKDLTRLLFLSWDKDLYVNENSVQWQLKQVAQTNLFEEVLQSLEQKTSFLKGNRNKFIYQLACECCKSSIIIVEAIQKINKKFISKDFTKEEIETTINSAYQIKNNPPEVDQKESYSILKRAENFIVKNYEIRLNEVSGKIECKAKNIVEPFTELNEHNIYRTFQHNNINLSQSKLNSLLLSDFVPKYNPFNNYFESLDVWNENIEPDYIERLSDYVPTNNIERFKLHLKKMLVRCIACSLEPQVFNKQVFVLVGEAQNTGKSTFCRWLCPPALEEYITEYVNTDKDGLIILATNFIINMDELATLSKTEINTLKSFISKDKINIRLPFAKKASTHPRRANFIGSTNNDEFLTDETGSVRWLCFEITGKLNFNYSKEIDINNIWKQAYTLYKSGFVYQLTVDEIKANEIANRRYLIETQEAQLIRKYFIPSTRENGNFYDASDVLDYIIQRHSYLKSNCRNVGKALRLLGFEKSTKYDNEVGFSAYGYFVEELFKVS